MSLILSTALVAVTVTLPSCSWDRPGADPYMGSVEAAVDRYTDIPVEVRARLKGKMRKRAYDDIAEIRRDRIQGARSYTNLRDMHFGQGRICREVSMGKWRPEHLERGLVYCEGEHCLIIPTVCRNVSRVTPKELEIETALGREEEPIDPPSAAGANQLSGQRFLADAGPLADGGQRFLPELPESSGELTLKTDAGSPELPSPPPIPDPNPPVPFRPVPEPEAWALMLAGLALVGRAVKRRRAEGPDATTPA